MRFNFFGASQGAEPVGRISRQEPEHDIFERVARGNVRGELNFGGGNVVEGFFTRRRLERCLAISHFVHENPKLPPVDRTRVPSTVQDFRRKVLFCADEGVCKRKWLRHEHWIGSIALKLWWLDLLLCARNSGAISRVPIWIALLQVNVRPARRTKR